MDKDTAGQDTERLNNGTATLAGIVAEYGDDWKDVIRQRGRELKEMAKHGVAAPASSASAPAEPAPDDEMPGRNEGLDRIQLQHLRWLGRGDNTAVAASGILNDVPAILVAMLFSFVL